jgi:hypothetical protein
MGKKSFSTFELYHTLSIHQLLKRGGVFLVEYFQNKTFPGRTKIEAI